MKSRLGFGCSGVWGEPYFPEKQAVGLIHEALEVGITTFDTAGFYAGGEAERRLGVALKESRRGDVIVSTKTGTRISGGRKTKDFSEAGVRSDVEASLARLGRERLDVLHLHGPSPAQIDASLPMLLDLKRDGKIGAIGVCGAGGELDHAVATEGVDAIMCTYNILHKEHAALMRAAREKGMTVFGIAPLAQALYRPGFFRPKSVPDLWYLARALVKNRGELTRGRRLRDIALPQGWSLTDAALCFALANADIDYAFFTTTRAEHLRANAAAAERPLPGDLARALAALA